jgi:hypothetical protein
VSATEITRTSDNAEQTAILDAAEYLRKGVAELVQQPSPVVMPLPLNGSLPEFLRSLPDSLRRMISALRQIDEDRMKAMSALDEHLAASKKRDAELANLRGQISKVQETETQLDAVQRQLKSSREALEVLQRQRDAESRTLDERAEEIERLRAHISTLDSEFTKVRLDKQQIARAGQELGDLQSAFCKFAGLTERIQEGYKHYFSGRQDTPAAAMVGFLTSYSLWLLAQALMEHNDIVCDIMLGNVDRICNCLREYGGFERAGKYLRSEFGIPGGPTAEMIRPGDERGDAVLFQFILRYLKTSQKLDVTPYYFWVDKDGRAYRAA